MAKKKQLEINNKEIYPITNEKLVLDNNGVPISSKYIKKEDVPDLSHYISNVLTGDLNNLPSVKSDFVSAINEIMIKADNQRLSMISVLKSIGFTDLNNSSTWNDIINAVKSDNFVPVLPDFVVLDKGIFVARDTLGPLTYDSTGYPVYYAQNYVASGVSGFTFNASSSKCALATFDNFYPLDLSLYKSVKLTLYNPSTLATDSTVTCRVGIYSRSGTHNQKTNTLMSNTTIISGYVSADFALNSKETKELEITLGDFTIPTNYTLGIFMERTSTLNITITDMRFISK